jgi:hypothetical protein
MPDAQEGVRRRVRDVRGREIVPFIERRGIGDGV